MEGTATISTERTDSGIHRRGSIGRASGHCESKYEGAETDSGGTERVVIPAENVDIVDKSSDTETKEDK